MPSVFTQIINREVPANIRYEDDHFIAFDDIKPSAPVDIVVATKREFPSLQDVPIADEEIFAGLLITVRKVVEAAGISENYRLVMNVGNEMQMVKHIHIHVMGGWSEAQLQQIKLNNI